MAETSVDTLEVTVQRSMIVPQTLRHILLVLCLLPALARAQEGNVLLTEKGLPFYLKQYSAHEYGAYPQNWSITQDRDGLVYVGNYDGILVYDGSTWELVRTPTNTTARSLAADEDGKVFVGLQGDFGYLSRSESGSFRYTSLVARLPQEERDFRDVWATHVTPGNVYFQTHSSLFRWDGESFKVWHSSSGFHTSFEVAGSIYVRETNVGLLRVKGDSLHLIPGGERFADSRVYVLEALKDDVLVAGTRDEGLLLYDGQDFQPFATDADTYLREHRLYHGTLVSDGYVALGLLDGGGLIILDSDGDIVGHYTEETGLPDGWVNHVFRDAQGGLWLALNNRGVVRIDPLSKITRYGAESGIDGVINDIIRYHKKLYVAASTGLLELSHASATDHRARFSRVDGIHVAADITPFANKLLVTSHDAIRIFDGENLTVVDEDTYFGTAVSHVFPNRFYAGSKNGVALFELQGTTWRRNADYIRIGEEVRRLQEGRDGTLWLVTRSNRVFRVEILNGEYHLKEFAPPGLEIDGRSQLVELDGNVYLLDESGYVKLEDGEPFDEILRGRNKTVTKSASDSLLIAKEAPDGSVWRVYSDRIEINNRRHGGAVETPEVLTYPNWFYPVNLHIDSSSVAWISSGSLLIRYDPSINVKKSYEALFPAQLRRVTAIDANRRLFGGIDTANQNDDEAIASELAFAENALRFEFALPSYNDPANNEFQYWLEGRDDGWSEWTKETSKNYTNLWEGTYRFHVRGRNAQGYVSEASVYSFTILPPWYRSTWAYSVYLLGLVGVGLFGRRYRRMVLENKRAKEQAAELVREREVNERLQDLNKRLEQANETLRQADRLKDEFLANTSHELRTPLTGILGCSAILREEVSEDHREFVNMIDENGQRLLNTLDSLLDLARLRAGLMELDFKQIDLGAKTDSIVQTYASLASSKGIDVQVNVDGNVTGFFDDHCVECVLNHLIGNAVKFTDEGQVCIHLVEEDQAVVIRVEDSGVGIDEEFKPFLFDEFKQESTGLTRSHEGNGLGLAVTARLVDLMGGDIAVQSRKHVGTTFIVQLPLEREQPGMSGHGDGLPDEEVRIAARDAGSDLAA